MSGNRRMCALAPFSERELPETHTCVISYDPNSATYFVARAHRRCRSYGA